MLRGHGIINPVCLGDSGVSGRSLSLVITSRLCRLQTPAQETQERDEMQIEIY